MTARDYMQKVRSIVAGSAPDDVAAKKIEALELTRPVHLLTVKEFCFLYGKINRSTLWRWRRAGRVEAVKTVAGLRIVDAPLCNISGSAGGVGES